MAELIQVRVEPDHLQGLIGSRPLKAVAELVWNAVDADAESVIVTVAESELGGIEAVRVKDDGHGMSFQEAVEEFSHLGGSWKRRTKRSRVRRRFLHGSKGRGRWRAYAIGERVRWVSVSQAGDTDGATTVTIEGHRQSPGRFSIDGPQPADLPTGTTVIVDQVVTAPEGLMGDTAIGQLTAEFATYLEAHPVEIVYHGTSINPEPLKRHFESYEIDIEGIEPDSAVLTVIEWTKKVDRALYLCDERGTALERLLAGVQAPGFDFTAYLKWEGFREHESELSFVEMGTPILSDLVQASREKLREHFRSRAGELTKALIEEWKQERVYPYENEPSTTLEAAEQDLFDVVALAAAPAVNRSDDRTSKRLTLRLIKSALNQSPGSLRRVLTQVLDLTDERIEELDNLLRHTPLTAVITAARKIADRLEFLKGLELLLYDPESSKTLQERSQLHRMLAGETWVFGEEYNLMGDDSSLTTVLRAHIALLGREKLAVSRPVRDEQGKLRFVDLAMGRALRANQNRREHLVVEIKRPSLTLGGKEIAQIENYAAAVANDPRFSLTEVQWDFYLVGNKMGDLAQIKAIQKDKPPGLIIDSPGIRVWVKTWSQILAENEHRLKFVQKCLEYLPTEDQAIDFLQRTYSKYLPDNMNRATQEDTH